MIIPYIIGWGEVFSHAKLKKEALSNFVLDNCLVMEIRCS